MGVNWINVPIIGGLVNAPGAEGLVLRPGSAGVIEAITLNLDVAPGAGESLTCRIGTDLGGVLGVDFNLAIVLATATTLELDDGFANLNVASDQNVLFQAVTETGGSVAADLSGNIRFVTPITLVGVLYTTKERVFAAMGKNSPTTAEDDEMDDLISGVSRAFDGIVGDSFVQKLVVEKHDGFSQRNGIVLDRYPSDLQANRDEASVSENGDALTVDTQWEMDAAVSGGRTVYRLNDSTRNGARFATGEDNIEVTYKTAPSGVPADIANACVVESIRGFQNYNFGSTLQDGLRVGISSRTQEQGPSLTYGAEDFSPGTLRTLDSYRQRGIR